MSAGSLVSPPGLSWALGRLGGRSGIKKYAQCYLPFSAETPTKPKEGGDHRRANSGNQLSCQHIWLKAAPYAQPAHITLRYTAEPEPIVATRHFTGTLQGSLLFGANLRRERADLLGVGQQRAKPGNQEKEVSVEVLSLRWSGGPWVPQVPGLRHPSG